MCERERGREREIETERGRERKIERERERQRDKTSLRSDAEDCCSLGLEVWWVADDTSRQSRPEC